MTLQNPEISNVEHNAIIETPSNDVETNLSTLENIEIFAKNIAEMLEGVPMKQALGSLMVEGLVEIEHTPEYKNDRLKAADKAKEILTFLKPFFGNEWRAVKSGFLGEVAVRLALEEMTFKIREPTSKEDLEGKIDLWADDRDGKTYAIQIKTSVELSEIGLYKICPEKKDYGVFRGYQKSAESMIKYTTEREEYSSYDIIYLILELPGGEGNVDACYNQITGVPGKDTVNKISDKFWEKVWYEDQ